MKIVNIVCVRSLRSARAKLTIFDRMLICTKRYSIENC
nr:MAG TPA: hypothetical protein [Microviridae sp.]